MQFLLANPVNADEAALLIDQVATVVATFGQETAHRKGDVASRLFFDLETRTTYLAGHDVLVIGAEAVTLFYAAGSDPQQVRICAEGSWHEDLQRLYHHAQATQAELTVDQPTDAAFAEPALADETTGLIDPAGLTLEDDTGFTEVGELPFDEAAPATEARAFSELDELFAEPAGTGTLEMAEPADAASAWDLTGDAEQPLADDLAVMEPVLDEAWEPAAADEAEAMALPIADEPLAEPDMLAVGEAEPQTVAEWEAEPQAVAEWEAELQPVAELEAEPQAVAEWEAELQPVAELETEPQAVAEWEAELQPVAELEAEPQAVDAWEGEPQFQDEAMVGVAEPAVEDWPQSEPVADDVLVMGGAAETTPAQPAAPAGGPSWLNEGAVEERPQPKAPSGPAPAWMDGNPFEDRPKPKAPSGPPPAWLDGNPFEDRPKPKAPSGPPPSWLREGPADEPPPPPKSAAPPPSWMQEGAEAAPAPQPAAAGDDWSTPAEPETWAEAGGLGLDAAHQGLLQALSSLPSWQRQEFDQLAATYGLDPDQAIEVLNTVAIGIVGRPVCEGDDPIWVAEDLAQALLG